MHRRADRYRSIAIVKGYRTVKILWPTDECRKSSRLYKWENSSIFSHFWRNLLVASTTVLYEDLPFNTGHTVGSYSSQPARMSTGSEVQHLGQARSHASKIECSWWMVGRTGVLLLTTPSTSHHHPLLSSSCPACSSCVKHGGVACPWDSPP